MRIGTQEALAHATRARIVEELRTYGPFTRTRLARSLEVDPRTLRHHLAVLTALRIVHATRSGRALVYALGRAPAVEGLDAGARRTIALLLLDAPRTQREIALATGMSQRLVAYHLARLGGRVERAGSRPARYAPSPELRRAFTPLPGTEGSDAAVRS